MAGWRPAAAVNNLCIVGESVCAVEAPPRPDCFCHPIGHWLLSSFLYLLYIDQLLLLLSQSAERQQLVYCLMLLLVSW